MARRGRDDESPLPEMVVIPGAEQPDPRAPHWSRVGLAVAAVAVFAVGVVLGRGSVTVTDGFALTPESAPLTSATPSMAPPATTRLTVTESVTVSDPGTTTFGLGEPVWPGITGACGMRITKPFVDSFGPPPRPIDLTVIAGGSPATADLGTGEIGPALLVPPDGAFVSQIAATGEGVVAVLQSCDGRGGQQVVRAGLDGSLTDIPLPESATWANLIAGGDRLWVSMRPSGYAGSEPIDLVAADDPEVTVEVPVEWVPIAGYREAIVAQHEIGGRPLGEFALIDIATGTFSAVVQIDFDGAEAVNAVAQGDYLIAAPWNCPETCSLVRYHLATGDLNRVHLAIERLLASGTTAISPDGSTAAVAIYLQEMPPGSSTLPPGWTADGNQVFDGPARVGMVSLANGVITPLHGLTIGPGQAPALAFTPDGDYLVVAVSEGQGTKIVVYTADGHGPYDPGVTIPGPVLWSSLAISSH